MTNVKIQMTNQIQMIKCLNDSGKIGRPVSLQKAAFQAENNSSPDSQKVGSIWGLRAQIPLVIQSRA